MSINNEQIAGKAKAAISENNEDSHNSQTASRKKQFIEPSVSVPVKVLEATKFLLQGTVGAAAF